MTIEEMIRAAEKEGFQAAVISTDKIVFNAAFRPYCAENLCGQYGANYSCPPDCGTPDDMERRVLSYPNALVLRSECEVESFAEKEMLQAGKRKHNEASIRLIAKLREAGHEGFMVGASGCALCKPCAITVGEACRFPTLRYSCMSAYCIYVKKLAEDCALKYDYENGILPYFGMFVFR